MFTVNKKDTRLTLLILNIVNIDIHNTHYSCAKVTIFRQVTPWWDKLYHRQSLSKQNQLTSQSLSFNFAMTKICVVIRLAEGGTIKGGI